MNRKTSLSILLAACLILGACSQNNGAAAPAESTTTTSVTTTEAAKEEVKLGLTEEAWDAFSAKLNRFNEENRKPEEKRRYIIDNDAYDLTSDEAVKILEDCFYGKWERVPQTGGDYDEKIFAYNEDSAYPFDFEYNYRPTRISETKDIYYMECISSGEPEVYVIEKSDMRVMYCASLVYYNGYDSSPAVDLSEDLATKYEYAETLIDKTVRPGKISVLGQNKIFSIYGEDFEKFFDETLDNGFDSNDGEHYYVDYGYVNVPRSDRYLVERGDDFVTLGIRYFKQSEDSGESEDPGDVNGDTDDVEILEDTDSEPERPEYYFAVTFRKESGKWTVNYRPLEDVYFDAPDTAQTEWLEYTAEGIECDPIDMSLDCEKILLVKADEIQKLFKDFLWLGGGDAFEFGDWESVPGFPSYLSAKEAKSDEIKTIADIKNRMNESIYDKYTDYLMQQQYGEADGKLYRLEGARGSWLGVNETWYIGYDVTDDKIIGHFAVLGWGDDDDYGVKNPDHLNDINSYEFYDITVQNVDGKYVVTDVRGTTKGDGTAIPYDYFECHGCYYNYNEADRSLITNEAVKPKA